MAFFLAPRFAPAYTCNPYSGYCAPSRPVYRQSRPAFPSFVPFLAQVDELLSEIDREARREAQRAAHIARLQRKRAYRQRFNVEENKEGWEVKAEIPGFAQENIQIEVTDEQTLRLAGNTEWRHEHAQAEAAPVESAPVAEPEAEKTAEADAETETMDGVTITEADAVPTPTGSDTESHKSYQATVEDDFEDLGAETSSTVSAASEPEAPKEPKGKEKVVDESAPTVAPQQQPGAPAEQQEPEEKYQGAFERTFKFPVRIDAGNVRASFKDGVLSINVPRAPVQQARQITIQ